MGASILVVDDEESIRYTFETFLRDEGYTVATARNGGEALTLLEQGAFDVIFADILLQDCTGLDLLRQIKERGLNSPVIMITGYPNVESASQAVRLGAFDYLVKPVRQDQLLHAAFQALRHKALAEEKEKYRANLEAIFRSVKDAIITVDQELKVVEINDAAMEMCGYGREVIGKPFEAIPKGCQGRCIHVLKEAARRQQPMEARRIECQIEGRPRYVLNLTVYPLLDSTGANTGFVLVFKDETRLVSLEESLAEHIRFHRLVGESPSMRKLHALIDSLSQVQTTVLITGETGTGKELVAEALHYHGPRGQKPLVKVNCSALAESLLESELFGHVKGAFTGALQDKIGRFQRAHGGTIFLDEIGDLSPRIQQQLLRVLQEREFERVGDTQPIKVDVRVVTATNKRLQEQVRRGDFREDLYYRLKVVEIVLPPLRDRKEDIPLLAEHFMEKFRARFHKEIQGISSDVLKRFQEYAWPGNVRELEHILEHAFVLCRNSVLTLKDLPEDFAGAPIAPCACPEGTPEEEARAISPCPGKNGLEQSQGGSIAQNGPQNSVPQNEKAPDSGRTDREAISGACPTSGCPTCVARHKIPLLTKTPHPLPITATACNQIIK